VPGSGIPGMNRILRACMCRRGANPRRVVSRPSGREGAHGFGHSRGRAKRTSGATACESVRGSLAGRTPWRSKPRRGGGEPTSRYSRGELEQRSANAQECGGRAATRGLLSPRAFARGCAGRALGPPSGVSEPVRPLPARRPRDDSPGVCAPAALANAEDPVHPGDSTPRHLPPSGFGYPPGGLLSSAPRDGPSTATAPMGFALQGLAPPRQRCLSRGLASPVVLPVRPKAGGRDSRG
jgi:hypothetical protein